MYNTQHHGTRKLPQLINLTFLQDPSVPVPGSGEGITVVEVETSKPEAEAPVNEPGPPISAAEAGDREEVPSEHLAKDETSSAQRTQAPTPTPSSEPHPLSGKLQSSRLAPPSGEQLEAKSVPNVAVSCIASLHQESMKTSSATMLLAKNYKMDQPSLCTGSKATRATGSTPSLPVAKAIPEDARKKLGSSFHTLIVRKRDNQQDGKLGERGAPSPRPPDNQDILPPANKEQSPTGSKDMQEPAAELLSGSTDSAKEKEGTALDPKKTAEQTVEVAEGKIGEGKSGKHGENSRSIQLDHCYTKTEPVEQPPSDMKGKGKESKQQTKKNTEKANNATTGSSEVGVGGESKKDSMEQAKASTQKRDGDKDVSELAVESKETQDQTNVTISVKEEEKEEKALEDGDKEETEVTVGNKEGENEEDREQVDKKREKEKGTEEGKKEEKEERLEEGEEGKKESQEEMEKERQSERQINVEKKEEEDSKKNAKERTEEVKNSEQVPVTTTESKEDKKPNNAKENNPAQESNPEHADTIPSDTTGERQPHPLNKTPKSSDTSDLKEEMPPTAQDEVDLSQSTVQATKAFSTSNLTRSTQSLNISSHTKNLLGTNMEPASTSKPNFALGSKSSLDRIGKKAVEKVSIDHSTGQSQSSIMEAVENVSEPSPVTTET